MKIKLPINAKYEINDKKGVMSSIGSNGYTQSYTSDGMFLFKGKANVKGTAIITFDVYGGKIIVKLKAK